MTYSSRAGRRTLGMACGLIMGGVGLAGPAGATTYNETFNFNPASLTCGYFGADQLCAESVSFGSTRAANAGDIYNINVTMPGALNIPGSKYGNMFLVNLLKPGVSLNPGAPGGDVAKPHISFTNYSGPANPISGGGTTYWDQGYFAVGGFCCGYGEPNAGFSLSGAAATIRLASSDSSGLASMAVSIDTILSSKPRTLDLAGGAAAAPVVLPKGEIGTITGDISGGAPDAQFYQFQWGGGQFEAIGQVSNAPTQATLQFELTDYSHNVEQTLSLNQADNFSGFISLNLSPGVYTIGLLADPTYDPHYKLQFLQPIRGGVPEPGAWAVMLLGLGLTGGLLRRRIARA
jgi:hypothetical protein